MKIFTSQKLLFLMQKILPITRNLLIINVLCYAIQYVLQLRGIDLVNLLGLHFALANDFHIFQLFTYMFLHGSLTHLFFNMFSLWMFGSIIEQTLGSKRFLIYYLICGVGAGLCQEFFQFSQYYGEGLNTFERVNTGAQIMLMSDYLNFWTTIGASGACYGVLLAFGMLYPNERIMLLIPPIPMKAKYFVAGYAAIELFMAYSSNDNIAHFAHLGGMIFGFFLLRYWRRKAQQSHNGFTGWNDWEEQRRRRSRGEQLKEWIKKRTGKDTTTAGNAHHAPQRETDYEYNIRTKEEEKRMDEILDKIRISGYESLTEQEKRELFRISRK